MKVLIVVAPYHYPNAHALRTELLGVLYLAAALRSNGHEVEVFDPTIGSPRRMPDKTYYYGVPQAELEDALRLADADVVAISCHYAFSHRAAYQVASLAKQIDASVMTVMGGLFASVYQGQLLADCPDLDYVLRGEAEASFLKLLAAAPGEFADIDGLVYRSGGVIKVNDKKDFIMDLDALPFPARDLVDIHRYMNTGTVLYGLGTRPTLSLLTSRSCPHRCAFCNMWLAHGSRWRPRSTQNVLLEIDEIVGRYKAAHMFIMDDNFTFDPGRAKEICAGMISRGYRLRWNTPNGISVKGMDLELARLMKRAGCVNVCLGVESGSERVRREVMKKNVTDQEITHAVECLHAAGIPAGGFIALGMPGEDEDDFKEALVFIKGLKLSFIAPTFAIPFRGTKLYNDLVRDGVIDPGYVPQMDNFNYPAFATRELTAKELIVRRQRLLAAFYSSHAPQLAAELVTGRLNWISWGMFKRVWTEKFLS